MPPGVEQTPFVKQLAASDRPTRDKALESLTLYLTSGRTFTYTELLIIWKGLFYCIHHTANPLPQQRLSECLASLLVDLPKHVFIPFLAAFFQTIISYWSSIPALRLDKFLYLIRLYISHSFQYLSKVCWSPDSVSRWSDMMTGRGECQGVLDPQDGRVGDGLRYHVLDVWVDGLVEAEQWEDGVQRGLMKPVESVVERAATKTLRERARGVVQDERINGGTVEQGRSRKAMDPDDSFEGLEE